MANNDPNVGSVSGILASMSTTSNTKINSGMYMDAKEVDTTSLSETRRTIIDDVMIELGYPVVSLFITQMQINQMIDFSVRKCAPKACPRFLTTLYARGCVDVSQYKMEAVSAVYSGDIGGTSGSEGCGCGCDTCGPQGSSPSSFDGCNVCEKLCQYRGYSAGMLNGDWNNQFYDLLAWQNAKSQMQSLMIYDYYLDNINQKLYLDNYSGTITVEYTKSGITIEDLQHDTYWYTWIRDYTLALCKIIEGRIRNKFKLSSAPFEIEGDELISEGNNDKQELEQKLDENIGYYTLLRS